jgi:hypothetical protein
MAGHESPLVLGMTLRLNPMTSCIWYSLAYYRPADGPQAFRNVVVVGADS